MTNSEVICTLMAQPTTLQLKTSVTTARDKNPPHIGTHVILGIT